MLSDMSIPVTDLLLNLPNLTTRYENYKKNHISIIINSLKQNHSIITEFHFFTKKDFRRSYFLRIDLSKDMSSKDLS